jgi:hypothetical protein
MTPEPAGSSPYSQEPAIGPYPEPTESTPHPPASLSNINSDPKLPSTLLSSEWSLSFGLSHQNPVHFPACTSHLILLDLVCLMMSGDEYKIRSSSLCSFLHSPVTSSFFGDSYITIIFLFLLDLDVTFSSVTDMFYIIQKSSK